jgi:hypothetical protein
MVALVAACAACVAVAQHAHRSETHATKQATASGKVAVESPVTVSNAPAEPWPGPEGEFVFVEAESFARLGGWRVVPSVGGARDREQASRGHVLSGSAADAGEAELRLAVPSAGDYRVWIRASRPDTGTVDDNAMNVRISQAGATVPDWKVDVPTASPDGVRAKRHDAFGWLFTTARLEAGAVDVRLSTLGPPKSRPSFRRVDCLLFTKDVGYEPDHRDFEPQTYLRVRLQGTDSKELALSHTATTKRIRRGPFMEPLHIGESGPWMNITRWTSGGPPSSLALTPAQRVTRADYMLDFAAAPQDSAIVRSIHRSGPGGDIALIIPSTVDARNQPWADFELAAHRAATVAKMPRVTFGKRPTIFPCITGFVPTQATRQDEVRALSYAGINGRTGLLDDRDIADGLVTSRLYNSVFYRGPHGLTDADLVKAKADLDRAGKEASLNAHRDRIRHVKLIDEAQPDTLEKLAKDEHAQGVFKTWLAKNKYSPFLPDDRTQLTSARERDAAIRIVADRGTKFPALYFYSQRFRAWTIADYFRQVSGLAHAAYPPGVATTQNFSDGAVFAANLYGQGNDYFEYFENGALDVAQSEDWTNKGSTRELAGWNVALLRAATRRHGQPIHMYVITYNNRKPLEVKLKALTSISEGAKLLNFYSYLPLYQGRLETGWAESPLNFTAVAELTREIGAVEDVLMDAMPRPARAAILYSIPADIWNVGYDTAQGIERMFTYLALRHAQVPVDVVSDDQARAGFLSGYDVVYLSTEHLDHRNVDGLGRWVRRGGVLVLGPGAGGRDEYNRKTPALARTLGLRRSEVKELQRLHLPSRTYCLNAKVQDVVTLASGATGPKANVFGWQERLQEAGDARVLARFAKDGSPASIELRVGKGRVVMHGFFPGLAYGCSAVKSYEDGGRDELVHPMAIVAQAMASLSDGRIVARDLRLPRREHDGYIPFSYDGPVRQFIVAPASDVKRPLEANVAQVEAAFLEGKKGFVVPLANYTGAPVKSLEILIRPGRKHGAIRSARRGPLATKPSGGGVSVTLPLESTDFLVSEWAERAVGAPAQTSPRSAR